MLITDILVTISGGVIGGVSFYYLFIRKKLKRNNALHRQILDDCSLVMASAVEILNIEKAVPCPVCPVQAYLVTKSGTMDFKEEKFSCIHFYYECPSCEQEFTTNKVDHITIMQVWGQYKSRHPEWEIPE